jgi:TolB-like protein
MAIALIAGFVLAAVGLFVFGASRVKRSPGPDVSTIAVIPFSDLNPHPGDSPFTALFTRQLADAVSRAPALHLTPVPQAGNLIEGSVQNSGDRVRVAVWLVRAVDRRALWSQRYEFAAKDAAGVQSEIVSGVANALHLRSGPAPPR